MTRTTNARLAGITLLLYIATGVTAIVLFAPIDGAGGTAAKLASIAEHAPRVRAAIVLTMLMMVYAFVLAVTLHALTRDQDPDIALLALVFRVGEGVLGSIGLVANVSLLWLGTSDAARALDAPVASALGALVFKLGGWSPIIGAFAFAVGSLLFAWLFAAARTIPAALAWLGVVASALLVSELPLQLAGLVRGPVVNLVWIPMALFEVGLGVWLIVRGTRAPASR